MSRGAARLRPPSSFHNDSEERIRLPSRGLISAIRHHHEFSSPAPFTFPSEVLAERSISRGASTRSRHTYQPPIATPVSVSAEAPWARSTSRGVSSSQDRYHSTLKSPALTAPRTRARDPHQEHTEPANFRVHRQELPLKPGHPESKLQTQDPRGPVATKTSGRRGTSNRPVRHFNPPIGVHSFSPPTFLLSQRRSPLRLLAYGPETVFCCSFAEKQTASSSSTA